MEVPESKTADLTLGSKLAFFNWIWYISFLWCLKGVLLHLYYKLGTGLRNQENIVIVMSGFTFATWLACILTHICICTPLERNWQIKPYPGGESRALFNAIRLG